MANGQTGVEEIWDGVEADSPQAPMATKATLILIAKRLESLPCDAHKLEIKKNSDLRKKLMFGFSILCIVTVTFKWVIERFV